MYEKCGKEDLATKDTKGAKKGKSDLPQIYTDNTDYKHIFTLLLVFLMCFAFILLLR